MPSKTPPKPTMHAHHNPNCPSSPYHHILAHTSDGSLLLHQRPDHPEPFPTASFSICTYPATLLFFLITTPHPSTLETFHPIRDQSNSLNTSQAEFSYSTRRQPRILKPRGSLVKSEVTHISRTPTPNLDSTSLVTQRLLIPFLAAQKQIIVQKLY